MGYYRALEKITKNNVVQGYKVLAPNSDVVFVDNKRIKEAIKSKQAIFLNLNIDSAGRLVMSDEHITGKLKIVAEAFKSITKDNYSPIKLMENYMSTYFNNGEYTLVADFGATRISCLYNNNEYVLASKEDVIKCAKMILGNKNKKDNTQNVKNTPSNDGEIYFTIKLSKLYNLCMKNEYNEELSEAEKRQYKQSLCNHQLNDSLNLSIKYDSYSPYIKVINKTNKKVNFIVIADHKDASKCKPTFVDSIINNISIKMTEDMTCTFAGLGIDRCIVNSVVSADSKVLALSTELSYIKTLYMKQGLLETRGNGEGILMFDTITVEDYVQRSIYLGLMYGKVLNIKATNWIRLNSNETGYINNINVKARKVTISISEPVFTTDMTIEADDIHVDCINQSICMNGGYMDKAHELIEGYTTQYSLMREIRDIATEVIFKELSLGNPNSIIYKPGKINFISDNVEINTLITNCTVNKGRVVNSLVNDDGKITTLNSAVSTSLLSGRTADNLTLDTTGGIFISNGTSLTLNKLVIGKNLRVDEWWAGIRFDADTLKDFEFTILDSIKLQRRTNDYTSKSQYRHIMSWLIPLSKIKPINVKYGTNAYNQLVSAGVDINILNLDSISDKVKNRTHKEDMIGKSFFDTLKQNLSEVNFDDDKVSMPAVPIAKISETYYKEFEINSEFDYNTQTINISRQNYWIYNILGKFSQVNDIFKDESLNALHSNNYVSMIKYTNSYNKDKIRVGVLSIAKQTEKTVENIIFMLYDNVILRAVNMYDYYMLTSGCLNNSTFKALASISNLDEIDFDNNIIKQSLTLNTCEYETEKRIVTSVAKLIERYLPVFISTHRKNIIIPLTDNSAQMFNIKCEAYTAKENKSLKIDTKHPVLNMASYKSITNTETTLEKLKNTFDKQFSDSIAYDIISNSDKYSNIDMLELPAVECSTIHQIAMKYSNELANIFEGNDVYAIKITKEMLTDLVELPIFNLISNKIFKELINSEHVAKTYTNQRMYSDDLKVTEYVIKKHTSIVNKAETEYTAGTEYVSCIAYDDKEIYAVSTLSIIDSIKILKEIVNNSRNKYNTEDYINYLGMTQAYNLEEFMDKLKVGELDFIVGTYKMDYKNALTKIYKSKRNFYDKEDKHRGKRASLLRRTVICVDNVTGYMYLCVEAEIEYRDNREYVIIPLSRLKDFRTASMLNGYIVKFDEYTKNKTNNIILDVADSASSICELMLNQYNNNKNKGDYKKFIYTNMIAFNSHQTIFEKFSKGCKVEDNTFNIMPKYSMGIIIKYINMGGLQIVKQIPQGFSIVNSYIGEGTSDKIDEYRSQSSEDIYYVIREMILKSEFELQDLLDL